MHDLGTLKGLNQKAVLQKAVDARIPYTLLDFDIKDIEEGNMRVLDNLPVLDVLEPKGYQFLETIHVHHPKFEIAVHTAIKNKVKKGYAYGLRVFKKGVVHVNAYLPV